MAETEALITPLRVERACRPGPSIEQLVLKPRVDATEHVFERRLIKLNGVSLPGTISSDDGSLVFWDLYVCLKLRQDWEPSGHGLGDLLYAISLLPNEELTLEIKTWETSTTQQDREDTTDIRNVSDLKTTTSAAHDVTTRNERQTSLHIGANASGGMSGVFSASVETDWDEDVTRAQEETTRSTAERVQQVTAETRATRKVRIAISRTVGSELKTTRRIRNINQAHTLNANFFEVLREYAVTYHLAERALALLGAEVVLSEPIYRHVAVETAPGLLFKELPPGAQPEETGTSTPPPKGPPGGGGFPTFEPSEETAPDAGNQVASPEASQPITLADLLVGSRSPAWIDWFIRRFGFSPIRKLHELWCRPLYDAALVAKEPLEQILPDDQYAFQSRMLELVRPGANWVEVDERGALRWCYEIIPGREEDCLVFLAGFLPFSLQQLSLRADKEGMERRRTYIAAAAQRLSATSVRDVAKLARGRWWAGYEEESLPATPPLRLAETEHVLVPGLFQSTPLSIFTEPVKRRAALAEPIQKQILEPFGRIRPGKLGSFTATLPTQGVYADLSLGICSGAEDVIEANQQLDLKMKQLEIEKRTLEIERLQLQNAALAEGRPLNVIAIRNPAEGTRLDVTLPPIGESGLIDFV